MGRRLGDGHHSRTNGNRNKQFGHRSVSLGGGVWVQRENNLRMNSGFAIIIFGQFLSHFRYKCLNIINTANVARLATLKPVNATRIA
jgi:hypothetical protein